jgi:outer membrane protein assembly factor BamE (lipoprotein component of BamABCDE complex)
VLAVVLGMGALFINLADSYVAADPSMGRYYMGFKWKLKSDFEAARERTWEELDQKLHGILGAGSGTAPLAATPVSEQGAAAPETADTPDGEKHGAGKAPTATARLLPYVTVGLTRDEVELAQGPPTASSSDKLIYGSSEVDLKDGKVAGWKVDSRSPLRVKLWPEGPVDASLRYFTIGSTKDEVLAVQGTPTSFSEDRFDYGSSSVYFRDKWVVDWKSESGSVALRAER